MTKEDWDSWPWWLGQPCKGEGAAMAKKIHASVYKRDGRKRTVMVPAGEVPSCWLEC